MNLLSVNDWKHLGDALRRMEEIVLERELGERKVRASTVPANNAWRVAMLVRIERWEKNRYDTQYFESVEEAMRIVGVH